MPILDFLLHQRYLYDLDGTELRENLQKMLILVNENEIDELNIGPNQFIGFHYFFRHCLGFHLYSLDLLSFPKLITKLLKYALTYIQLTLENIVTQLRQR